MSNTPLEQNGADLLAVLAAINELPEYQEIAPEVDLDFFSLYDAVKIAEWEDTVNLAADTSFDPTEYVDNSSAVTIRPATAQSAERSITPDLNNYLYVATLEWYFVPRYTSAKPSQAYMIGKASMKARILYRGGGYVDVAQDVKRYLNWNGVESELVNDYGIYFGSASWAPYDNGVMHLIIPALVARASSSMASADSLRALDKANCNLYYRTRVYRLPHEQFANLMYTMCNSMIANEAFEGGA